MTEPRTAVQMLHAFGEEHGGLAETLVDTLVAMTLVSGHAREHCDELAEDIREIALLTVVKIAVASGVPTEKFDVINDAAKAIWEQLKVERLEALAGKVDDARVMLTEFADEVALAMAQRGQLRLEDIN